MSPHHLTALKDVSFSASYDRASFDEFVDAATAAIDLLHRRIEAAQAHLAHLRDARAAQVGSQAELGLCLIRAQVQIEQERLDTDETMREIVAAAEQAAALLLAEARAEVRLIRASLDEMGVAPEDGMGQLLRFRAHPAGHAARTGEHADGTGPVADGCPDDGPAGPVAAIS